MGANTVSNHNLAVVTKGTPHNATTKGAADVNLVPPTPTPTPFVNYVPSSQLGPGQTTKTFIAKNPIVTKRAIISPPSQEPHAGTLGGETSHTYLMEASMVGSSTDVFAEGSPVCRSTDATKQNHGNSDGSWIEGDVKAYLAKQIENQKKRCTIVKIEAKCKHGKGRELGFPPGESGQGRDGYYLEILSDDVMTYKATRKSAVPGETEPDCMFPGKHTKWVVKRSGGGESASEKPFVGDDQVFDRSLIGMLIDEAMGTAPKYKNQGDKLDPTKVKDPKNPTSSDVKAEKDAFRKDVGSDVKRDAVDQAGKDAYNKAPLSPDEQSVRDRKAAGSHIPKARRDGAREATREREAASDAAKKEVKDAQKATGDKQKLDDAAIANAVNFGVNMAKFALLWYAKKNPLLLEIEASACSGAKNSKLVVFPAGKAKFDMFSERWSQALQALNTVKAILEKLGKWFGVNAQVKFLEKPQVSLTIEFKELSKDWPKNHLTRWQVQRAWDLSVNFDPFLSVKVEVAVPIPTFLAPMGALLAKIVKYFGAEGVVYVSAELQIVPSIGLKWDEYNEVFGYVKVSIKLELQLGIRLRWGDTAEIWAAGYCETTLDFPEWRATDEHPVQVKLKGEVQFGFKGGAWADVWGWRKSVEFNYRPPNWNCKMGERWLNFLPMP